jgi:hypothetical protein
MLMERQILQPIGFTMSFPRHTGVVCPTPCHLAKIITSSPHISPDFSFFRAQHPENLIDNPGWFWFHETQMWSNLHRRPGDSRRP